MAKITVILNSGLVLSVEDDKAPLDVVAEQDGDKVRFHREGHPPVVMTMKDVLEKAELIEALRKQS